MIIVRNMQEIGWSSVVFANETGLRVLIVGVQRVILESRLRPWDKTIMHRGCKFLTRKLRPEFEDRALSEVSRLKVIYKREMQGLI
ncbi:hypothetical protein K0M31_007276 [Melipona bicolor]|uniref:Uncharacterized protein n=1 Tax=Melipona bicolor TaxID=60889 RepID=A0AA40GB62_9HYME|nr:hypothetical protein K0M31_007276 [Melipona bicolor]